MVFRGGLRRGATDQDLNPGAASVFVGSDARSSDSSGSTDRSRPPTT